MLFRFSDSDGRVPMDLPGKRVDEFFYLYWCELLRLRVFACDPWSLRTPRGTPVLPFERVRVRFCTLLWVPGAVEGATAEKSYDDRRPHAREDVPTGQWNVHTCPRSFANICRLVQSVYTGNA